MAKQTIKHSCGCEVVYNLTGTQSSRCDAVDDLSAQECPNCIAAAKAEQINAAHDKINVASAAAAAAAGRPELIGSPKQVSWATTIREDRIKRVEAEKAEAIKFRENPKTSDAIKAFAEYYINFLIAAEKNNSAKYWIERREYTGLDFQKECRSMFKSL